MTRVFAVLAALCFLQFAFAADIQGDGVTVLQPSGTGNAARGVTVLTPSGSPPAAPGAAPAGVNPPPAGMKTAVVLHPKAECGCEAELEREREHACECSQQKFIEPEIKRECDCVGQASCGCQSGYEHEYEHEHEHEHEHHVNLARENELRAAHEFAREHGFGRERNFPHEERHHLEHSEHSEHSESSHHHHELVAPEQAPAHQQPEVVDKLEHLQPCVANCLENQPEYTEPEIKKECACADRVEEDCACSHFRRNN